MIQELINEIVQAETQAEAIVKESVQKSKEIIADANLKAMAISKENIEKIRALIADSTKEAENEADKLCKEILTDGEESAKKIIEIANKNLEKTIDEIVRMVIAKYANS